MSQWVKGHKLPKDAPTPQEKAAKEKQEAEAKIVQEKQNQENQKKQMVLNALVSKFFPDQQPQVQPQVPAQPQYPITQDMQWARPWLQTQVPQIMPQKQSVLDKYARSGQAQAIMDEAESEYDDSDEPIVQQAQPQQLPGVEPVITSNEPQVQPQVELEPVAPAPEEIPEAQQPVQTQVQAPIAQPEEW
jgi:hypothetical protein